jgi:uncharacterized protein
VKSLDIEPQGLRTVLRILTQHLPEYDVYAFGSRVTGTARKASDLDLVVMTSKSLSIESKANLREAFSESDLPFKVDVVDWADTDENFRKLILRHRLKIKPRAENSP